MNSKRAEVIGGARMSRYPVISQGLGQLSGSFHADTISREIERDQSLPSTSRDEDADTESEAMDLIVSKRGGK